METQLVFDNGSISPGTIRWVKFCCLDTLISLMANKSYKVSLKKRESRLELEEQQRRGQSSKLFCIGRVTSVGKHRAQGW